MILGGRVGIDDIKYLVVGVSYVASALPYML
jgi:hypothetical protein